MGSLGAARSGELNERHTVDEMELCLSGQKLFGDDFDPKAIEEWHNDEQEAYADLGSK